MDFKTSHGVDLGRHVLDHGRVFRSLPNPCAVLSPELIIVDVNDAYVRLSSLTREQLVGHRLVDVLPSRLEDAIRELRASLVHVVERRQPHSITLLRYPVATDPEPLDRYWTVQNMPMLDAQGNLLGILNCPIEVTSMVSANPKEASQHAAEGTGLHGLDTREINRHLEQERRRFRALMQQAPGFVAVGRGPDFVFELANNAYYQLVGHRDILGKPVRQALPELEGQGFFELLDRVYGSGQPYIGRAMPIQVQAEPDAPLVERHIDFIYQPILDEDGRVSGIFVQGHDVTEAHELSRKVSYQAAHDSLTGLANRREFEARLASAMAEVGNDMTHYSLIYLDLDQFKVVNDTCGHAAGDELLRQVSKRLQASVSADDTVARLGGDEFGILLKGVNAAAAADAAERLRQIVDDIEFSWERRLFGCSASLGVITLQADIGDATQALSAADSACFLAKERGRNRVQIHRVEDNQIATRRREMDWVSRLRAALAESRFFLHAQRIVPTRHAERGGKLRAELLLRLREPDGKLAPPMAFIPAAERFGLMPAIDRWVIREAFARLAMLPEALRTTVDLAINLSGTTLSDDRFLPFVREILEESPGLSTQICFEVTETAALQQLSQTADLILELKALGFRFALDDFGSGMSSLNYLKNLPVDHLKIDGSFIRQITTDPVDAAMVEAMAKVASVMGIQTVAEYVEDEPTRALLERLQIDFVQGFGVHVPEPLVDLMEEHVRRVEL